MKTVTHFTDPFGGIVVGQLPHRAWTLQDTSTCSLAGAGIEPLTLRFLSYLTAQISPSIVCTHRV